MAAGSAPERASQGEVLGPVARPLAAFAVEIARTSPGPEVAELEEDLPVLEQERDIVGANLENGRGPVAHGAPLGVLFPAETGVEEACVVVADLAHADVDRQHLGCQVRGDPQALAAGEDVEAAGVEDAGAALTTGVDRLPEIEAIVDCGAREVDRSGVQHRAPPTGFSAFEADPQLECPVFREAQLLVGQRSLAVEGERRLGVDRAQFVAGQARVAHVQAQLGQSIARTQADRERERHDLEPQRSAVARRGLVVARVSGDHDAAEQVAASARTPRVEACDLAGLELEPFLQRCQVDLTSLQNLSLRRERAVDDRQLADAVLDPRALGEEPTAQVDHPTTQAQVEARRLYLARRRFRGVGIDVDHAPEERLQVSIDEDPAALGVRRALRERGRGLGRGLLHRAMVAREDCRCRGRATVDSAAGQPAGGSRRGRRLPEPGLRRPFDWSRRSPVDILLGPIAIRPGGRPSAAALRNLTQTMNIHEFQAKELLRSFGVATPNGRECTSVDEAAEAHTALGTPVTVVKAQIHAGGRGKAGGVKVVKSADEARTAAGDILGKTLVTHQTGPDGQLVRRLWVEEGSAIAKEYYLGIVVDRSFGGPVMMASSEGGMDIEEVAASTPEKILKAAFPSTGDLDRADAERLAKGIGMPDELVGQAADLMQKLAQAFCKLDCSLAEINPLVHTDDGKVVALDAKINFDDNALYRHDDVVALRDFDEEDPKEIEASKFDLSYIALDGNIACMVNGAGLAMATMDVIKLSGGEPANFLDVGGGATVEKVTAAFKILLADDNVTGVLVNIFGGIMKCDVIAEGVIAAVKEVQLGVPLVVRLEGTNVEKGKELLEQSGLPIITASDLDDAATKIVAAVS